MDQKTPREARERDEGEIETIVPLPGEVQPPPKRELFTLSPINRRRWRNFNANRRGFWSLWIFLVLFGLSLFAEFLANDKPLIVSYKGEILYPVLVDYPEEKFGGFFAVTDYRSPFIRTRSTPTAGCSGRRSATPTAPPTSTSRSTRCRRRSARPSAFRPPRTGCTSARSARRRRTTRRSSTIAAQPTGTGSAPTTRAATCWRG